MSWNVFATARTINEVGQGALELFAKADCNVIIPKLLGPYREAQILEQIGGKAIDAVLCSPDQYTASILASPLLSRLKILSRWGVGYDSIDVPAATREGIVVAYTPGFLNETVADYTFGLLLCIARRIHEGHLNMREGRWATSWGHDVAGKTLGIVGCGRIGRAVAKRATGFSMKVLGFDPHPSPDEQIKFVTFDQLIAESDFICIHAAVTPENRGLFGEAQFQRMKPTTYVINSARGALIDEPALVKALTGGWIAGAALDVYAVEPLPEGHPFRTTPNLLLSPHQCSFARETGERVTTAAAKAITDLKAGRRPEFVVDPKVFESPALRAFK